MTTNISKASPNKFQLVFPLLPEVNELADSKQFSLNIVDGIIPSFSIDVLDMPFRGGNTKFENGIGEFSEWTTTFTIDSEFLSWIVITDWMFSISNSREIHGRADLSYAVDANLHVLDNFDNKVVDIKYENIWPSNIGDVSYSYQQNDTVLTCQVTFTYDRYYRITSR